MAPGWRIRWEAKSLSFRRLAPTAGAASRPTRRRSTNRHMLRVEMLPAAQGDALWIEYGDATRPRRVLVDGGTASSWRDGLRARVESLPRDERHFELLIVTHIDADHIDGALALLTEESLGARFGDVWFNGWR